MGGTLDALLRLQEVETRLAALRRQRESKERRIEVQRRQVRLTEEQMEQQRRLVKERQLQSEALTLEVASVEEAISKHRETLNKTKTNREYSAILFQMNTEKADNAKRENGILQLLEQIQGLKNDTESLETQRERLVQSVQTAEEELERFDAESGTEMEALRTAREQYAAEIPATTLSSFSRVAEHHDGEAMAPVVKVHPKRAEYACSGCNMTVSMEVVNALWGKDDLQLCNSCGRILYLEAAPAKAK